MKKLTRVLSGKALIPISNSRVFWMTKRTVNPVKNRSNNIAKGYTKFLWNADELRSLSSSFRSISNSFSLSFKAVAELTSPFIGFLWYRPSKDGWRFLPFVSDELIICKSEKKLSLSVWRSTEWSFQDCFYSPMLANFLLTLASSKLKTVYSSLTSRRRCGLTKTFPTTPKSLTNPKGVQTRRMKTISEKHWNGGKRS